MQLTSGSIIKGYKITDYLTGGGMGGVYRAYQETASREVAIKVILPKHANTPDFIKRFEAEAQVVARLEHPYIVPLYDYWRDPNGAYLVMRLLRGGSLKNLIKQQGAVSVEDAVMMIEQVCQALHKAHRNKVIHRDIKPGNILLDEDGNAYLADFGIAKDHATVETATDLDAITGTPEYLSPEQARSEPVTPQSDIYSLGVVLYEMLAGEHPFPNSSQIQHIFNHLNEPLPEIITLADSFVTEINEVIQKATCKDPNQRYDDALAFAQALREAAGLDRTPTPVNLVDLLTPREQEVLNLIVKRKTNRQIAEQLVIEVSTVKWYVKQIYKKLGVRSRVQAIVKARDLNLVFGKPDSDIALSISNLPEPENPYKGLQAFQAADAQNFFGREKFTEKLLTRLQDDSDFQRFLAVVGPSGSGKSSVVKAGLVPAIWRGEIPDSDNWYIIDMLPGEHPFDELEVALYRIAADTKLNLREQLERDKRGLLRVADMILPDDGSELLLIIDQFEEVFTLLDDEEQRQHFLSMLMEAVTAPRSRVRVVVTLRADYYDKPLQYPEFGDLLRSRVETILPLSAEELERVINEPALQVGVSYEDGLVSGIVSDVRYQPGALPLLQYALTELFERHDNRILTVEAYNAIGGTGGALANRADEIFNYYDEHGQELIRQMLLRLVTLGEGAEDTRRRTERAELLSIAGESDLMDDIIDTYAESRLLALDHDPATRQPTVEVAHEAILREWERLRGWLNASREDIRQERVVATAAHDWDANGRDKSYLLRGARLEQIEVWSKDTELILTPLEQKFIYESVLQRETEIKEKETQRNVRRALIASVLAVLLMGIGISTTFGVTTQQALNESERIRLAAQAQNVLNSGASGDLPALLALRSLERGYSPDADAALLTALDRGFPIREFVGHTDTVQSLFSPDGLYIISFGYLRGRDSSVRVWSAQNGEEIERHTISADGSLSFILPNRSYQVNFSFPPHEQFGGADEDSGSYDVEFIDLATGKSDSFYTPFSPDGIRKVDVTAPRQISIVDRNNGQIIVTFDDIEQDIIFAGWSTNTGYGVLYYDDQTIGLWDYETGRQLRLFEGYGGTSWSVAISHNAKYIAAAGNQPGAVIWNTQDGEILHQLQGHTDFNAALEFSSDDQYLLTSSNDGSARLWHVESGQEIEQYIGHTAGVWSAVISPNDEYVVTSGQDRTIRLWNLFNEIEPRTFAQPGLPHGNGTRLLSFDDASNELLRIASDGFVLAVDTETKNQVSEPLFLGDNNFVSISPDGMTYLVGYESGEIAVYNATQRIPLRSLIGHEGAITSLASDPITSAIAYSVSADGTIRVWNIDTGTELRQFNGNTDGIKSMAIALDGQRLATGNSMGQVIIWDVESGTEVATIEASDGEILAVEFSPDGSQVLSGGTDRLAKLWDVNSGDLIREFRGHTDQVLSLNFNADGSRILTGSADQTARLWDVRTGQTIRNFTGHISPVEYVLFSDDGEHVFTSDVSETYMWRADIEDVISVACERLAQRPRDFTTEERALYSIDDNRATCPQLVADDENLPQPTWTPVPPMPTPVDQLVIEPLPDLGCEDYLHYKVELVNDQVFTSMGVTVRHVFVENSNGNVVRTLDTTETGLLQPLYAAGEEVDLDGPPFDVGPYTKGNPIGITVGHWLNSGGTSTYTRCNGEAKLTVDMHHLVPNGLYTMWCWAENATVLHEDPCGNLDGSDSIFYADEFGNATYEITLDNFLLDDPTLFYGIAAVYHSDGNTYGDSPGIWGQNAHFQTWAVFQEPES